MSTLNIYESVSQTVYHWLQGDNLFPDATAAILIQNDNIDYEELVKAVQYESQWLVGAEIGDDFTVFENDSIHCVLITTNEDIFERWVILGSDKLLKLTL